MASWKLFHPLKLKYGSQKASRVSKVFNAPAFELQEHGCIGHKTHR